MEETKYWVIMLQWYEPTIPLAFQSTPFTYFLYKHGEVPFEPKVHWPSTVLKAREMCFTSLASAKEYLHIV